MSPATATTISPFVVRSLYRCLLRSSKPFSPPSPNYAVYASLLHRSGISHDWEECIYRLEKKRSKKLQQQRQCRDNRDNTSIPKSWAMNLTRSYVDLKEDYQLYKESLASHDFDSDDDDDDDDYVIYDDIPIGTTSPLHDQYDVDEDPKFVLFRHLLREWFAGDNHNYNIKHHDAKDDDGNSWPRHWSADEEGYYENGRIKQVPLMRFPSQIMNCNGGLSIRSLIQREFRAPTVEEKYERECKAKEAAEGTTSSEAAAAAADTSKVIVYPPSSYIDNPIRLQTAFYTLHELNRKLAWAEKIGVPTPNHWTATRRSREWKRLVQAAKGVSQFPSSLSIDGKKRFAADDDSSLLPLTGDEASRTTNDEKKQSYYPLECGTLVIAHPLMTGYFANSVIILLDHTVAPSKRNSNDPSSNNTSEGSGSGSDSSGSSSSSSSNSNAGGGGTYGLIINRLALQTKTSVESTQSRLEILRQRFEEKKERDLAEILLKSNNNDQTTMTKKVTERLTAKCTNNNNARRPISLLQAVRDENLPETVRLAFGDTPIREGGPVNLCIQMIHRAATEQNDLESSSSTENENCNSKGKIGGTVIPSHFGDHKTPLKEMETTLFGGDVMKASYAVLGGVKDADDFSFVIGASCWSPGQLENEIQRGYWLPFCGPSSMAMTGMCDHYDTKELEQLSRGHDTKDGNLSTGTKLSSFPPRPSNAAKLSVEGSATRGSNNTHQSGERPVGDLWLSIMCSLSQGEADLAYVMLDSSHVKDDLGDACDNFYRF